MAGLQSLPVAVKYAKLQGGARSSWVPAARATRTGAAAVAGGQQLGLPGGRHLQLLEARSPGYPKGGACSCWRPAALATRRAPPAAAGGSQLGLRSVDWQPNALRSKPLASRHPLVGGPPAARDELSKAPMLPARHKYTLTVVLWSLRAGCRLSPGPVRRGCVVAR